MAQNGKSLLDNMVGVGDAVLLEPLTEENFVENLHDRFQSDDIYTYIGNVVVSVNPYKDIDIYDATVIERYRGRNFYELPPHIYAVSNLAYQSMKNYSKDQCILITGESGSGKTEASKLVMKYVAAVSSQSKEFELIKQQLLQSNPVLEAFGNAKTNRNDNSSRFGKYMDIEFDFKGDPLGGVISNYLLEKSRVVRQAAGERNFHIFYQLLSGAPQSTLRKLGLDSKSTNYRYLSADDVIRDDEKKFKEVMNAFDVIGFTSSEVEQVLELVSAVLKLGNIEFQSKAGKNGMEGCVLANNKEVDELCELLSIKSSLLVTALTERTVVARNEKVTCKLSANEASYSREALCKEIYDRMFSWLVRRINSSIEVPQQKVNKCKVMGVLDIYGFEIFERNGFEQFMINYCNEKLQQIFIELTLKEEQEEYIREGIEWLHIDYFNNSVICHLIENSYTGILSMLDEECLRPGNVTDQTFLTKLESVCGKHEHFESRRDNRFLNDKSLPHDAFRILHYAGKVTYHVESFIDKNNNALYRTLSAAAFASPHPLLGGGKGLFPEGDTAAHNLKRPPTTGTQFKASMSALMKNLLIKNPNYIRCIKPNDVKRGSIFSMELVRHQVRYLGLLENVRVKRAGYAYRQLYEDCVTRYKMLSEKTWPVWKGNPREGVQHILFANKIEDGEYEFGNTKIFIRNPKTLFALEELRSAALHQLATILQSAWKGFICWKNFQTMKRAQIVISKSVKRYQAETKYQRLRTATIVLQCFTRGWKARCLLRAHKLHKKRCRAVSTIAAYWRGHVTRVEYRKFFRANAGKLIATFMEHYAAVKFVEKLKQNLPTLSPTDKTWPQTKISFLRDSNIILRDVFHRLRCKRYRSRLSDQRREDLVEKLFASEQFRGKKALYESSVPQRFIGDHMGVASNPKWGKLANESERVVFSDEGFKIHRTNGKFVSSIIAVSNKAFLLVDGGSGGKSLKLKSRIAIDDVRAISFSPFHDGMVILHVTSANHEAKRDKGDLILNVRHSIEFATKLALEVKKSGKEIKCQVAEKIDVELATTSSKLAFSQQSMREESPIVKKSKDSFLVLVPAA